MLDGTSTPEEDEEKSEYPTKKRKVIVLRGEEEFQKWEKMPSEELLHDKLFIAPLTEYVPDSRKEKERKGEKYNTPIREYRSSESFFPRKLMEQCHEEEPWDRHESPKYPDFDSKEFYRRVHEE